VSGPKNSPHNKSSRSGDNQPDLSDDSKAQKRQYQDYQPVSSSMYSKQSRLFKRAKTKEDLNKDIIDLSQHSDNLSQHSYILSQLDINAGYQYIIHNNLEEALRNEVGPEDDEDITTEELWTVYFETNNDKPNVQLKETALEPIPSEIILPIPSEIILPKKVQKKVKEGWVNSTFDTTKNIFQRTF
jgi:hypothetical protein